MVGWESSPRVMVTECGCAAAAAVHQSRENRNENHLDITLTSGTAVDYENKEVLCVGTSIKGASFSILIITCTDPRLRRPLKILISPHADAKQSQAT